MARRTTSTAPASLPLVCSDARDRLADQVLGLLNEDEARDLSGHLEWCAGCRKELQTLQEGVAAVGLALEPIAPPAELEEKVVQRVSEAAGLTARERRRFRIVTAIAVVMTFVAIISLSWAAIVAGRHSRLVNESLEARTLAAQLESLVDILGGQQLVGAALGPVEGRQGGGRAYVILNEGTADFVLVIVGGLPENQGPYEASLVHPSGIEVPIGPLYLARDNQLSAYRSFGQDVAGFRTVVVTDAAGHVVLRGAVGSPAGS